MRVAVIDYGMGNIRSVAKALEKVGVEVKVVDYGFDIDEYDKFVLPGVGAFGDAVEGLKARKLWDCVKEIFQSQKPYLGICLGMQILCKGSDESRGISGLGIFDVVVRKFRASPGAKVPQMGWNQVKSKSDPLFSGLAQDSFFYFCHSYYVPLEIPDEYVIGVTNYTLLYASAVRKGNIWGVQFHPEKSQKLGLALLRNFIEKC